MPRLKDRLKQIPHGLQFFQPETKWKPFPFSSFNTIVLSLIEHRRGNPYLAKQHQWAMDYDAVAREVDIYNAKICEARGWTSYIIKEDPVPKVSPRPQGILHAVGRVVVGANILNEWLGAGGVPVAEDLANSRAGTCAATCGDRCPQNAQGDWTSYFTVPAANRIRKQLALRHDMSLVTPYDDQLGVCDACGCPLKLKVHTPITHIKNHMKAEDMQRLDPRCWIPKEIAAG